MPYESVSEGAADEGQPQLVPVHVVGENEKTKKSKLEDQSA
jgi:hypothetical protein